MAYTDGEALILTRVIACSNFDANNTSRGEWAILNQGKSSHYAILRRAGSSKQWLSDCVCVNTHLTHIQVWQRWKDDGASQISLYGYVSEIETEIDKYPYLGNSATVLDSRIVESREPEEMWNRSGGPAWVRQIIVVEWKEQVNVTPAE